MILKKLKYLKAICYFYISIYSLFYFGTAIDWKYDITKPAFNWA